MRRRALASTGFAWMLLALAGCASDPETGPVEVKWDRDVCERCQMAIGDRRFAVQVREADGALHLFDDLGCSLLWLTANSSVPVASAGSKARIWVRDHTGDRWLDAAEARFSPGHPSPMGFGFAAFAPGAEGIGLDEVRARVEAREEARRGER